MRRHAEAHAAFFGAFEATLGVVALGFSGKSWLKLKTYPKLSKSLPENGIL